MPDDKYKNLFRQSLILAGLVSAGNLGILGTADALGQTGAPRYRITDLGTLGYEAGGYSINQDGVVAGFFNTLEASPFNPHGFIWDNGAMTDIGTLGGDYSKAYNLNDLNQVAGFSVSSKVGAFSHAISWENGVMTDLGVLTGRESFAESVNNTGQIVGFSTYNARHMWKHAVLWENGLKTDLGTLGGLESYAYDINNFSQIVGSAHTVDNGPFHACIWENGGITDLGALPDGDDSYAYNINDLGDIVGTSSNSNFYYRAVLWQNGSIINLGTIPGFNGESSAAAINNSGDIVGYGFYFDFDLFDMVNHAFVMTGGKMYDLNEITVNRTGWDIEFAWDINDAGVIVGEGKYAGSNRGFILNQVELTMLPPVPGIAGEMNTVTVTNAVAGKKIFYVYGLKAGSKPVPGCSGVVVNIRRPVLAGSAIADANGEANLVAFVPPKASGLTVLIQGVELANCAVTNLVEYTFP